MAVKTKAQITAEIASLLADNTTGDISASDVRTVFQDIVDSYFDAPYKKYKALLTQSGTSAPVASVLENTLSGTLVWTRSSIGVYVATLASEFGTGAKLFMPPFTNAEDGNEYNCIPIRSGSAIKGYYSLGYNDANSISLYAQDNTFASVELSTLIGAESRLPIYFEIHP